MNQSEFTRRLFLHSAAGVAATAGFSGITGTSFAQGNELKIWANPGVHKGGAKDWSAMESQGGLSIAATAKSARADESIQKMVVGDGNRLFDAVTDNGGGM